MSLFFFLTVLPHLSFRFTSKEEKVLPPPHWIEAQNRDAFQVWEYSHPDSDFDFVFSPLQDTRQRALLQSNMVFKVPALPKEEEVPALNELKKSLLENRGHQLKIEYHESLLKNSLVRTEMDFKKNAEPYGVKVKKTVFNSKNSAQLKNGLLQKFDVRDLSSNSLSETQAAAGWSGFFLKGSWRDGFDRKQTVHETFGRGTTVPVMVKNGYHGYFEEDHFQALDLRYGDGKASLVVFLPHPESSLEVLYRDFNFETWSRWMNSFIDRQGLVRLPKFKIASLAEECCQLTVFEAGEKGGKDSLRYDMTEILGIEDHFEFDARRPFFFAVRDNETGLILLMGQYAGKSAVHIPAKKLPA